jgi:cytochrome b561
MAAWTGWAATALIVFAAILPLYARFSRGKPAPPDAPPIRWHVVLGLATGLVAFVHTVVVVPSLGAPGAIGGGMLALAPGGLAFFLLVAHTGLGLQLREPKLKKRADKRRAHVTTALAIAAAVAVHVVVLMRG